jgi:hypothetical protein
MLAVISLANVNLLGVSDYIGGAGTGVVGIRFGWPMTFLWKDYVLLQSSPWVFSSGTIIEFYPISLAVNAIVSSLLIAGTAYWVERLCRELPNGSRFGLTSMLALVAWVATLAATHTFEGHWIYAIRSLLELVRILTLGAFWFGFFAFLRDHFGRTRST